MLISFDRNGALGEEGLHGELADFHADHVTTARVQPRHVMRLSTQRHEHSIAAGDVERIPVRLQQRMDGLFVESDLIASPLGVPEFVIRRIRTVFAVRIGDRAGCCHTAHVAFAANASAVSSKAVRANAHMLASRSPLPVSRRRVLVTGPVTASTQIPGGCP